MFLAFIYPFFKVMLNQGESGSPTATLIGHTLKHPPCDFYMSHFSYHQHSAGSEWYSDPFYTGAQQGYKMCLQVIMFVFICFITGRKGKINKTK